MIIDYILYVIYFFTIFTSLIYILAYVKNKKKLIKEASKNEPTITFLIPAYNSANFIENTLNNILESNYPKEKLNIIVVDNASTDNIKDKIKKFKNVKLIRTEVKGKAHALNIGIKEIKSEYALLLDSDTLIEKDLIRKCLAYFEDQKIGIVIPTLKPYKPKKLIEKFQVVEYSVSTFIRSLMSTYEALPAAPACTMFRTEILKKTQGYDEENLTEDLEMAFQVKKLGYNIYNAINATAYTIIPDTFKGVHRQRMRWSYGTLYNLKKHKDIFGTKYGDFGWFFMPMFILSVFFSILLFFIFFYNLLNNGFKIIRNLILTNFKIAIDFSDFSFLNVITTLKYILAIVIFIMALYIFRKVKFYYETNKEDNIKIYKYVIFSLLYTPFLLYIWVMSLIFFIVNRKPQW